MLTNLGPRSPLSHYLRFVEGEGEGGAGSGGGDTGDKGGSDKGVPQEKVNELVGTTRSETRKQTEERIAKDLGVPISEAKELIAQAIKRQDDEKSDAQKEREAAEKARKEADAEKASLAKERHEAKIERALVRAGVSDEKMARAMRVLEVADDADAEAVKKAVDALKSDEPGWFGTEGEGSGKKLPPAPGSDPAGKPPKKKSSEDAYERGQQRAKEQANSGGYKIPGYTPT